MEHPDYGQDANNGVEEALTLTPEELAKQEAHLY